MGQEDISSSLLAWQFLYYERQIRLKSTEKTLGRISSGIQTLLFLLNV